MVQHAETVNARLRGVFREGFALDTAHRPHVTLVQRFVRTADLDQVYAAAGKAIANDDVTDLKLEAFKYYTTSRTRRLASRALSSSRRPNC